MKIVLEEFTIDSKSSFRVFRPRLSQVFYWHFHPELELVYIEGTNGTRHVGEHLSQYEASDLVFIGSNIPHLNFDYMAEGDYEKVVLQVREDFLQNALIETPELRAIQALFERSKYGIAFGEKTKQQIAERVKSLESLSYFSQFLEILSLFQILATTQDYVLLHDKPVENQYNKKDQERIKRLYKFIDENYQRKIDLTEVAEMSNLSEAAFCRYFKKMTKLTFVEFLNHYRVNQAKNLLLLDRNVTETCFDCGFESMSYFNRTFKKLTGENPLAFKKRYFMK
ncbi:transcriptional regulator, AraC family [Emticicia oligotrophica DSM 17448]|uniref:Transcriptional regulator, AraC family n=1 Tax=Emticicia oligotrophica (strain DSM 17448 / CIP 109782 / MTCC 6937 / GPTSA100-15) TaxID=929562 RepID=A0ABN4AKQ8_EMTOG|nr:MULTISPECIES: AraC family transcriptional regulator [Emticicia]AFK02859.1 transcriptional regulator, AraC family [Emticicia oligotrophica DSM 17448]